MTKKIRSLSVSSCLILLAVCSCFTGWAQYEDKSGLKKNESLTDKYAYRAQFVPESKYGAVVTPQNLKEALTHPADYKSARFNACGISEFPEELFLFPNLEEIDISKNSLAVLPSRLSEFQNLKELHVNKNVLTALGHEIIACKKLEVLQIQNNPLKTINKEIGTMASLKEITIGEVDATCTVPAELWTLTGLKKIKITNAHLTEIPVAIGQLKQLNEICLSNNAISAIPDEFYTLKNIGYANFGYNKIAAISPAISQLQNLNYLGIYHNPLTSLPEQISSLKNLAFFSCWKTNIPDKEFDTVRQNLPKAYVQNTEKELH